MKSRDCALASDLVRAIALSARASRLSTYNARVAPAPRARAKLKIQKIVDARRPSTLPVCQTSKTRMCARLEIRTGRLTLMLCSVPQGRAQCERNAVLLA